MKENSMFDKKMSRFRRAKQRKHGAYFS